jgi:hypothetical protein
MGVPTADPRVLIAGREARPRRAVGDEVVGPDDRVLTPGNPTYLIRGRGLDVTELCSWLERTGVDAAWVGWGAPNEHRLIAEACEAAGVTFVGSGASALAASSDPAALERRMTAPVWR